MPSVPPEEAATTPPDPKKPFLSPLEDWLKKVATWTVEFLIDVAGRATPASALGGIGFIAGFLLGYFFLPAAIIKLAAVLAAVGALVGSVLGTWLGHNWVRRLRLQQEEDKRQSAANAANAELEKDAAKARAELEKDAAKARAELEKDAEKKKHAREQAALDEAAKLELEQLQAEEKATRTFALTRRTELIKQLNEIEEAIQKTYLAPSPGANPGDLARLEERKTDIQRDLDSWNPRPARARSAMRVDPHPTLPTPTESPEEEDEATDPGSKSKTRN